MGPGAIGLSTCELAHDHSALRRGSDDRRHGILLEGPESREQEAVEGEHVARLNTIRQRRDFRHNGEASRCAWLPQEAQRGD